MSDPHIYQAARACRRTFAEARKYPELMRDEWAERCCADFNLWAASEGVFAPKKASLDERLLLEPQAKEMVVKLIQMLEIMVQVSIEKATERRNLVHDEIGEDKVQSLDSTVSQALKDADNVLDQLVRVTHAIRRAGSQSRLRKADISFRRRLPELLSFRRHLELVLLARPSEHGTPIVPQSGDPDDRVKVQVVGPGNLSPLENGPMITAMQTRLIEANLRRRNRFLYAQSHSRKLAVERRKKPKDLFQQPIKEGPSQRPNYYNGEGHDKETVATESVDFSSHSPDEAPVQADEMKSTTTATQIDGPLVLPPVQQEEPAMTAISSTGLHIKYPNPPLIANGDGGFKCPCCCQYLPLKFSRDNKWRKHLATDIMPYTCVLAPCPFPEELFVSREGWERHMERDHNSTSEWTCHACLEPHNNTVFHKKEDFTSHLKQAHRETIKPQQISMLSSLWSRQIATKIESCPICGFHEERQADTLDHIAKHVHAFSLRSLPWGPDDEESCLQDYGNYFKSNPYFAEKSEGSASGDEGTTSSDQKKMETLPALDNSEILEAEEIPPASMGITENHMSKVPELFIREKDVAGWMEKIHGDLLQGDSGEEASENLEERQDDTPSSTIAQPQESGTDKHKLSKELIEAAKSGSDRIVEYLVSQDGVDPDCKDGKSCTPLLHASSKGHLTVVEVLLNTGKVNVNVKADGIGTPLSSAARHNHIHIVQLLIHNGADVNLPDSSLRTPLARAAARGHNEVVMLLLEKGADIVSPTHASKMPLLSAARYGRLQTVELLLNLGADLIGTSASGKTALDRAAAYGHEEVVKVLVERDVNFDSNKTKRLTAALIEAIRKGRLQMVNLLLDMGADIAPFHGPDKMTPLEHAVAYESEAVVQLLLDRYEPFKLHQEIINLALVQAIKNDKPQNVKLLLDRARIGAIKNEDTQTVRLMLEKGVDVNFLTKGRAPFVYAADPENSKSMVKTRVDGNGEKVGTSIPLHEAIRQKHMELAQLLVSYGADINFQNETGEAALHLTAKQGSAELSQFLCESGAEVDIQNKRKTTPLYLAAEGNHVKVVQLLIGLGAKIDTPDNEGITPFHAATKSSKDIALSFLERAKITELHPKARPVALSLAAREGQCDTIQVILNQGEDVNVKDWRGRTALFWAANSGCTDAVQLLLDRGADANCQPTSGQTILAVAAKKGNSEIVKMLLDKGADPNAQDTGKRYRDDEEGTTPLYWAVVNGHGSVAKLLLDNGADAKYRSQSWGSIIHVARRSHPGLVDLLKEYRAR